MKDIGDLTVSEIMAAKFVSTSDTKVLYLRFPFKVMGTLGTIHTERDPYLLDVGRIDPLIPRAERPLWWRVWWLARRTGVPKLGYSVSEAQPQSGQIIGVSSSFVLRYKSM